MPALNIKDFEVELHSGRISPLYLLVGEEGYLREKALQTLLEAALKPGARAFNLDVFRGGEASAGEIADRILSFPLMSPRRVVVVKACEDMQENATRVLIPLLESPPETTTTVFVSDRADGRRKFFAMLQKFARVVEFKPLKEREVSSWVQERFQAAGKHLSSDAARLLCERVGTDLGVVSGEIDKLLSFVDDRMAIERDDVERVIGVSEESSIFDLTDAVGARDAGKALFALRRVLDAGERGGGILWRLTQHFHTLMKIRIFREARVPEKELPGRVGLRPFVVSKYIQQSKNFPLSDLWRAYELLVTAEDRLKSGYQTEEIILQLLIRSLCKS